MTLHDDLVRACIETYPLPEDVRRWAYLGRVAQLPELRRQSPRRHILHSHAYRMAKEVWAAGPHGLEQRARERLAQTATIAALDDVGEGGEP